MTKSLMPGLVYGCGVALGTERFTRTTAANMGLIAFGVLVCAFGEVNLVVKGVAQQLLALLFEVGMHMTSLNTSHIWSGFEQWLCRICHCKKP